MNSVCCWLCRGLSPDIRSYVSHLRLVHSNDDNFSLVCGIAGCQKKYRAFDTHVYRCHRSSLGLEKGPSTNDLSQPEVEDTDCDMQDDFVELGLNSDTGPPHLSTASTLQHDIMRLLGVDKQEQRKEAASFLLKLKEVCIVSERTVNEVIACYEKLALYSHSVLRARISETLGNAGISMSDVDGLDDVFKNTPAIFDGLKTTHKQENYFSKEFHCLVSNTLSG